MTIRHGTNYGYVAHYKQNDLPVCEACREAHKQASAAYWKTYWKANRERINAKRRKT